MITVAQFAAMLENDLNALKSSTDEWEFKIYADVGEFKNPRRSGNNVLYTLNGQISVTNTNMEANVLVMGVNTLRLVFLVPTLPPRTNTAQTDEELKKIQDGQVYFVQHVKDILNTYFLRSRSFAMTDGTGEAFQYSMVAGVSAPEDVDIRSHIGESLPVFVYITLNFLTGGINALDIQLLMDGERIPYMSFNPSRATTLSTDLQSNAVAQKSIATASLYAIQFTAPSSVANPATASVYDFIADEYEVNTAHFIEVDWGAQRRDFYLMFVSSANVTAAGADFAGLNVSLTECMQNEEFLTFPSSFSCGVFKSSVSSATSIRFLLTASFTKNYPKGETPPNNYTIYFYIAGKAHFSLPNLSSQTTNEDGSITATYRTSVYQQIDLSPSDYSYDEESDEYLIYLISSEKVSPLNISGDFTFEEVS